MRGISESIQCPVDPLLLDKFMNVKYKSDTKGDAQKCAKTTGGRAFIHPLEDRQDTMNPYTATLRSTDICNLLNVTDRSAYRWLSNPYPRHVGATRRYALPEVVARLRLRRNNGLSGEDLRRVVTFDSEARSKEEIFHNANFMWLGDDADERAGEFRAALEGEEVERAREVQKEVRAAALQTGLPSVERLRQIVLHPSAVRFILTGSASETPCGDTGWVSFTKALWAINPERIQQCEAA